MIIKNLELMCLMYIFIMVVVVQWTAYNYKSIKYILFIYYFIEYEILDENFQFGLTENIRVFK